MDIPSPFRELLLHGKRGINLGCCVVNNSMPGLLSSQMRYHILLSPYVSIPEVALNSIYVKIG